MSPGFIKTMDGGTVMGKDTEIINSISFISFEDRKQFYTWR